MCSCRVIIVSTIHVLCSVLNMYILLPGMGTKVQCKSHVPGYYSLRDMNEDSSSSIWSPFHGDKNLFNGQYCNGFIQRTVRDEYPEYGKDVLKQKMIEHEMVFKNQVYTLASICGLPYPRYCHL